jgi:hypothetical protein
MRGHHVPARLVLLLFGQQAKVVPAQVEARERRVAVQRAGHGHASCGSELVAVEAQ